MLAGGPRRTLTRREPRCRGRGAVGPPAALRSLGEVAVLETDGPGVVRTVKTIAGPLSAGTGVEGAGEVVASYWLVRQESPFPLLLTFSSALVSMREEMVPLFDAIVSTVEWGGAAT